MTSLFHILFSTTLTKYCTFYYTLTLMKLMTQAENKIHKINWYACSVRHTTKRQSYHSNLLGYLFTFFLIDTVSKSAHDSLCRRTVNNTLGLGTKEGIRGLLQTITGNFSGMTEENSNIVVRLHITVVTDVGLYRSNMHAVLCTCKYVWVRVCVCVYTHRYMDR